VSPKARLGKGLDALLGSTPSVTHAAQSDLRQLPVSQIRKGRYQPRTRMDEESLQDLAASISAQGIVQPLLVRETAGGGYELIAGERRWRAAQLAGLTEVPAVVRRVPDEAALAVGLIENIQRENLNPIEEAAGLKRLLDEFGLTHQQAAEAVGRSRVAISNLLRLLKLDPGVREHLESGHIEAGHARALLGLAKDQQGIAAQAVMRRRLSVRQTEELVRRMLKPPEKGGGKKSKKGRNRDIERLEETLSEKLAAPVQLESRDGKSGRLVIVYSSLDELDGIIERLG
jgi:ParB family chromosome partitioning protein|tara:strand:+ start:332 stop:1192 length:861 start_codon:yes stop_codon:yes gene_type:complete